MTQPAPQFDSHNDLPTRPQAVLDRLNDLGVPFTLYHHEAVFTVAESEKLDIDMPGVHCRNLFLRDKKKNNFLVVLQHATDVDIKKLAGVIGSDKLSFGSAERLWEYLGVKPGSVCPYAMINDTGHNVKIFLEKSMMEADIVNYHPLINTMTVGTSPQGLIRFLESCGATPHIVDLTPAAPDKDL